MNKLKLEKVLEALLKLRITMHDAANTSALHQIDEAIELVLQGIEDGESRSEKALLALIAIGRFLLTIHEVTNLISSLPK